MRHDAIHDYSVHPDLVVGDHGEAGGSEGRVGWVIGKTENRESDQYAKRRFIPFRDLFNGVGESNIANRANGPVVNGWMDLRVDDGFAVEGQLSQAPHVIPSEHFPRIGSSARHRWSRGRASVRHGSSGLGT